jgi:hypothetical protein
MMGATLVEGKANLKFLPTVALISFQQCLHAQLIVKELMVLHWTLTMDSCTDFLSALPACKTSCEGIDAFELDPTDGRSSGKNVMITRQHWDT